MVGHGKCPCVENISCLVPKTVVEKVVDNSVLGVGIDKVEVKFIDELLLLSKTRIGIWHTLAMSTVKVFSTKAFASPAKQATSPCQEPCLIHHWGSEDNITVQTRYSIGHHANL